MDKGFGLERKKQIIYIGVAILIVALLVVILLHILLSQKEEDNQQNIESRLPTGNYLPDAENPLIRVVIKTNGFKQIAHSGVEISAEHGFTVSVAGTVSTTDGETMLDTQ